MNISGNQLRKIALVVIVITFSLAALPISSVSASGLTADDSPPTITADKTIRLEKIWQRLQRDYDRQGLRLDRAELFIRTIQTRLDQASDNGKDTNAVQAALDVFSQAIKNAKPIHQSTKGIITSHKGFDADGLVTDHTQALETVQSLGRSMKEIRDLVSNPFKLLRDSLRAFREIYRSE